MCRVEQKKNTPSNLNTNYRTEMKFVPMNMEYLLSFDTLKFYLRVRLHGESLTDFNFFLM